MTEIRPADSLPAVPRPGGPPRLLPAVQAVAGLALLWFAHFADLFGLHLRAWKEPALWLATFVAVHGGIVLVHGLVNRRYWQQGNLYVARVMSAPRFRYPPRWLQAAVLAAMAHWKSEHSATGIAGLLVLAAGIFVALRLVRRLGSAEVVLRADGEDYIVRVPLYRMPRDRKGFEYLYVLLLGQHACALHVVAPPRFAGLAPTEAEEGEAEVHSLELADEIESEAEREGA